MPEGKGPTVLTDLDVHEVSLVARGANRKRIAISKGEDMPKLSPTLKAALEVECKAEEQIKIEGDAGDAVKLGLRAISAHDLSDAQKLEVAKALGIKLEAPKPEAKSEPITKSDVEKVADPELRAKVEQLFKSQSEARAMVEVEKAEREKIAKALEVERRERVRASLIQKSETDLGFVPGTADEKADLLLAIRDKDPELAGKVESLLANVSKQLGQSELFKAVGRPGGNADARRELETKAAELRKSNPKLTDVQARVQVLKTDAALKARVRAEGNS